MASKRLWFDLQGGLVAVLLVTLLINIAFILDTSRKLQQDPQQTGKSDSTFYCRC